MDTKPFRTGSRGILASVCTLVTIVMIGAGSVQAQARADALTLGEAVRMAVDRNLSLRQSESQVALSETAVRQARANFYPNLNLSLTPSQRYAQAFDQASGSYQGQVSESLDLTASSSVNLFNGFGNRAAYRAAKLDQEASAQTLVQTRQRIVMETVSRFLQVNMDAELIRIEAQNLESQQQQLLRIQAFWEEGVRARADVLQQQAAVAQAELRLLNATRQHEVSKLRLKQTLNLNPAEDVRFAALSLSGRERSGTYVPAQLLRDALSTRSDIAAQQQRIGAAEQQIYSAKSGYWPSLSFSLSAGTNYSSQSQLSGFSGQIFDHNPSASAGLSLTFSIFDRSRTKSDVARAQVQLRNEQLSLETLEQTVSFEVQQAVLDYRTAGKQLEVTRTKENAAQEALAAMEERYNVGAAALAELSQVRADYVDAAGQRVEAQYNLVLQQLMVEFYRGHIEEAVKSL